MIGLITKLCAVIFCRTAIVFGTAIPLVLFLIWNAVILGTITNLETGMDKITDPLQQLQTSNETIGVGYGEHFIHFYASTFRLTSRFKFKLLNDKVGFSLIMNCAANSSGVLTSCNCNFLYWICLGPFRLPG